MRRFGTMPLAELAAPASRLAREGVTINDEQAYFIRILEPILTHYEEARAIYAPDGALLREGDLFRFTELGDALERLGAEGAEPFYRGEVGDARSRDWVLERGGTLGTADLAAYQPVHREPVSARFAGREVLTNPPPSSGGILIAYALELLAREPRCRIDEIVAAMEAAQAARTEEFLSGLYEDGLRGAVPRRRPARLDDPHHRRRRRGPLRERHLLERHRLGARRAGDRRPPQQHARRGGPEPARLPSPLGRAAGCRR